MLKQWWNRHRTGEKTGAALTFVAILVGIYFGVHPMKGQDNPAPSPPAVSSAPASSGTADAAVCPSQGNTLESSARALSCEIISFCTSSEAKAPSDTSPGYGAYEEQVDREASARYYARLVVIVQKLRARGLQSKVNDTSVLDDPDQDCDSLTTAANAVSQVTPR